ncbi:conserved hypothetical protein [Flavobacterium psychrophilum]|uniref:hypothetical protein n=1 Tax=Flavobacterium psychrophilum TaxID=96345 RepID=UPI000B7C08CA|nr:hypothetical protein [Flavobacterium psychrophilum]GEJ39764.1 hypothetical protein FPN184_contig00131-0001 [Flavobacterium psychrophilum]SNB12283.1 conserved hypothetical protein [Flavobacterium psychrophilum]
MKYIKFKIPENISETKKKSFFEKCFLKAVSFILMKITPKANPDFDNQIDNVEYWLLECEKESGIPEREIGIDKNGNAIVKMPFKSNYGYWTDNNLQLKDFIEKFKASEIEKREFESKWEILNEIKKNMVDNENEFEFEFVYVKENGKVRELYKDEIEYLSETFHPNDGGRPYIKKNYNDLTPDGKILGFIHRNRVSKSIIIEKEKANA